jgi:hypothetical protein
VGKSRTSSWIGVEAMTKEDALKLIKLLSATESWAFSAKTDLPEYLHEDLCLAVEKLEKIVLKEKP